MNTRRRSYGVRASATRGKDRLGVILIGAALLALGAMAAAAFALRPPPTDEATLCRTDAPIKRHIFILVDATDKLEARHRRRLRVVAAQERQRLEPYDRLSLATLRPDRPQEPRVLFSLCNPGDGRDANPLFQNTQRAQERWDSAFGEELDSAIRRAGGGRRANASPISMSVRAIAADPDFGPEIAARRLVLVSDLLEHNAGGFSLYAEGADFAGFAAAGGAAPDLDGVEVRVVTLDRPDQASRQARARAHFWTPYLDAADARDVQFDAAP